MMHEFGFLRECLRLNVLEIIHAVLVSSFQSDILNENKNKLTLQQEKANLRNSGGATGTFCEQSSTMAK